MGKHSRVLQVLFATYCLVAVVANNVARGDENRSTGTVAQQVERANEATEARFRVVANSWRQNIANLNRLEKLRRVASSTIDFEEKFSHAISVFDSAGGGVDRMRASIRQHVAD